MSNFIENHSNDEIVIPPDGKVQLEEKRCPLFEREDLVKINDGDWAFTRAYIDISPLKQKLSKLPEEVWTDEGQSSNIKLTRPAHDIWGIKKIVFVYCDDFLQKVYNFPWSESHEWKDLLIPIYKAINISEHQVVRCLLANMSPGCVIPVHHDTGYWVKYTHRMHLAIETGERVEFRVGPTDDRLKRISFDEGRLVELNNQAKHAVVNNMKSCRIHLIFDYIDDHPIERVYLQPGEILHQTRRSIDRQTDKGKRKSPSFIIIGAQKSGTTSLYELICQHPLVLRGKRRETHFFDWRWNTSLTTPSTQHTYCKREREREREYEVEDITAKNSREYIPIDEEIKKRLREFYKPYNNKLKEILGKEINW
mmetsp:Transcript_18342/g.18429  ORF Transcript_18342/g.18429 Transcript_18342/m.18429 type:complete len:366 (+) Transcript_18342:27-1124(+)